MKCKNQSNKKPKIRLPLGTICGVAGIIGIASIAATSSISASALSYSTSSDVSFTFAPTLSIGLSTDSLNIDNLVPGNISDSNSVKVTVSSNTPYGYVLSAGVGSSDSTSTYYNTSNLVHEDSTVNNAFTSIDTSANLTNLTTDNTWGYSTSLDNGTTWSTYSGLPSTTTKPLLDVSDPATPSTIDFKIAAKSSTTQASGTYNNVITFYAVGKPEPVYMQDVDIIKTKLKNEHDVLAVIDQRDGREYTAAKLKDGKIWMTQNLDLAGGTKLYSETSDVPSGFPSSDNIPYYTLPYSSIYGFSSNTAASLYNVPYSNTDRTKCGKDHPCYSYYSWLAATANSGRNIATNDVDAPYSICPRGWRLPTSRSTVAGNSDFYQLAVAYGMKTGVLYQTTNIVQKTNC